MKQENPSRALLFFVYPKTTRETRGFRVYNKGRYGYRRITAELRNCNLPLNHKTV